MKPDELYHFGIKGMKWGVRRFQNPDGTRTEAGKRRERKGSEKTKKVLKTAGKVGAGTAAVLGGLFARSAYNEAKGKPEKHIDREAIKTVFSDRDPQQNNTTAAERFYRSADKAAESLGKASDIRETKKRQQKEYERRKSYKREASGFSDAELKKRVSRLNLEKQYVDLSTQKSNSGRWTAKDKVDYGRAVVQDLLAVGMLINTGYDIYKKFKH